VITIMADGEGEKEVVNQIAELIQAGFVSAP
jgi:phosphotransferase system HPr-like phosphotransfer protein